MSGVDKGAAVELGQQVEDAIKKAIFDFIRANPEENAHTLNAAVLAGAITACAKTIAITCQPAGYEQCITGLRQSLDTIQKNKVAKAVKQMTAAFSKGAGESGGGNAAKS